MSLKYPHPKDPDDILDYAIDWTLRLTDGDAIATSEFVVVEGTATITTQSVEGSKTIFWMSGGLLGINTAIRNRITTTGGRQMDQTVVVKMKSN